LYVSGFLYLVINNDQSELTDIFHTDSHKALVLILVNRETELCEH